MSGARWSRLQTITGGGPGGELRGVLIVNDGHDGVRNTMETQRTISQVRREETS